jgi:AraC family transcriptional regulator of adaptative response / DNA-3-methyladenine glycosylase II
VRRGLRLIADGALEDGNLENLSDRLGVTSRHLRRLFKKHLGASPLAVAHTQRLHFAKNLIDQTTLSMRDISVAAGYGSVRRFNDTFKKTYGRSPRDLRRHGKGGVVASALAIQLPYRPPFDWSRVLEFFSMRATPGVERVQDGRYLRTIAIGNTRGIVDIRDTGHHLLLSLHGMSTDSLFTVVQRVRGMFDLDASTHEIARVLSQDATLRRLLQKNPGVRVPGSWNGYEMAVRAILGQQVSVSAATTLAGRLANRYGERIDIPVDGVVETPNRLFPAPQKLLRARLENLGIVGARAQTIRSLSRAIIDGELSFDSAERAETLRSSLLAIKGIGKWTAEYVAMRVLKDPDAFPASDLGLLRAFDRAGVERMKPAGLAARAEAWRPWRAYAALLLWGSPKGAGG